MEQTARGALLNRQVFNGIDPRHVAAPIMGHPSHGASAEIIDGIYWPKHSPIAIISLNCA
ncbi:hypothetical protein [Sphingomonas sp. TDK1]|uniref:hypothetical protein n=1 Tax=Sphingomonas sp. TDK1 TaxID=453247 RepID=UPI000A50643E|nr:hypothetical protein [Sphingomonas sp. TDK1]